MSTFDGLDETFNIVPSEVKETSIEVVKSTEPKQDIKNDYEYSRGQLYNLIEKGQEAINGIMDVAQQSDHPRAYEVALQGIKNVADMTDKLIDLQKKMKEIDEEKQKGPATVNNSVFIGSTADLHKFLKQQNQS
jgi:hypothetical protein